MDSHCSNCLTIDDMSVCWTQLYSSTSMCIDISVTGDMMAQFLRFAKDHAHQWRLED